MMSGDTKSDGESDWAQLHGMNGACGGMIAGALGIGLFDMGFNAVGFADHFLKGKGIFTQIMPAALQASPFGRIKARGKLSGLFADFLKVFD